MAKTATVSEQFPMPTTGKWIWKDETKSLEFISNNADKLDRRRNQRQRTGVHFQDLAANAKRNDRGATPNAGSRAYGMTRGRQSRGMPGHRSPRQNKQGSDHNFVTLEDVKSVAIAMLSEVDIISDSFEGVYSTEQLDEFLVCLLSFFHCFFEKQAHEQKPNPMNIEPSLAEKKYYADLCRKLDAAQKQLGQSYCVLVLGIGMDHQHHMACGQSRVSSTYKDRSMYETLYSFCTFVVWITFRRKEYDTIKRELGRMLRSDTFNPAIRVKNAPETDNTEDDSKDGEQGEKTEEEQSDKKQQKKQMTPAEYRRIHGKRPAIKSIINQRSPALVSILPSPKEEAHWLFKRTRPLSPNSLGTMGKDNPDDSSLDEQFDDLKINLNKVKVGIIGEPLNQFNPMTLTPIGAENEDENEGENKTETTQTRRESMINSTPHGKTPMSQGLDPGMSRQATAISQATTDALSDED